MIFILYRMDSQGPDKNVCRPLQGVVRGTEHQGIEEALQFRGKGDLSCINSFIATAQSVTNKPSHFQMLD